MTALRQPPKKNFDVLAYGTSRENVIVYLGAPMSSEVKDGKRVDLYKFIQGYSGGAKTSRALLHGIMDVLTLFIWELIAWPAEAIIDGTEMVVKVIYDENDKLVEFSFLKTG